MIVVDSSAVVAIFLDEPERDTYIDAILGDVPVISAGNVIECSIVLRLARKLRDEQAEEWLDEFLTDMRLQVHDVTSDHVQAARKAHMRFGKGTGHGAALNFGDCFSYALAKALDVPLLFKGEDFAKTDIVPALA